MSFTTDISKMNGSYVPPFFVSDGDYAWFVEGYTSDQFSTWALRVAPVLPNGQPDMTQSQHPYNSTAVLPEVDITMLRLMIGNTQRLCQGMPTIRIQREVI